MPRSATLPTICTSHQDIRSHAVDRRREKADKAKWNPKWAGTGVPTIKEGPNDTKRPRKLESQKSAKQEHLSNAKLAYKSQKHKKRPALAEETTSTDTSADESSDLGTSPDENEHMEAMFQSCDARGGEVLGMALNKAVEQYEDKQTAKLVNDEYEVLHHSSENVEPAAFDDMDEDYELV